MKRIAIVGCGNVGSYAVKGIQAAPDMDLAGIIEREEYLTHFRSLYPVPVESDIACLESVDGVLLAVPTRDIPKMAPHLLRQGLAVVDSFDIHGKPLLELLADLQQAAEAGNTASVSAAGWDPGTDSLIRIVFELMAPQGITYTNFGPGMSMGHTVAVKQIQGVADALSLTIPCGMGVHNRQVFVQLDQGADASQVRKRILSDPYFSNDNTKITFVDDVSQLIDMGHGVQLERRGVASQAHNQYFSYTGRVINPAVTAQVMVAAMRAALRQPPGAYVMPQIPLLDFLPGDRREWIKKLC